MTRLRPRAWGRMHGSTAARSRVAAGRLGRGTTASPGTGPGTEGPGPPRGASDCRAWVWVRRGRGGFGGRLLAKLHFDVRTQSPTVDLQRVSSRSTALRPSGGRSPATPAFHQFFYSTISRIDRARTARDPRPAAPHRGVGGPGVPTGSPAGFRCGHARWNTTARRGAVPARGWEGHRGSPVSGQTSFGVSPRDRARSSWWRAHL